MTIVINHHGFIAKRLETENRVSLQRNIIFDTPPKTEKKEAANVNSGKGELQLLKASFFFCWSHLSFQGCHLYLVIRFFFQWGFPDLGNQPATTTHPAGSELQDLRSHFTKTVPGLAGRNTQRFWRWTVSKVERPEKKNPRKAGGFRGIVLYAVLGGIF